MKNNAGKMIARKAVAYLGIRVFRNFAEIILGSGCYSTKEDLFSYSTTQSHAHSIEKLQIKQSTLRQKYFQYRL